MREADDTTSTPDRAGDGSDRARDASDGSSRREVTVDEGWDGSDHWRKAADRGGRNLATVEGRYEGGRSTFVVDRADAVTGPEGDRAAAVLADGFRAEGTSVQAASDARLADGGTRRDITDDLEAGTRPREVPVARPDIAAAHPDDYVPATDAEHAKVQELRAASDDPNQWVDRINPGYDADRAAVQRGETLPRLNRVTNCTEASRAVQDTLDGHPRAAAAGTYESYDRIDHWAGKTSEAATFASVEHRLADPGDSAVVVVRWDGGGGHAFNAVNIDGKVSYVDGQTGEVSGWPPAFASDVTSLRAWYFEK